MVRKEWWKGTNIWVRKVGVNEAGEKGAFECPIEFEVSVGCS